MKFKSILLGILFIASSLPYALSACAESEEDLTEAESTVSEDADPEIENHLAARKKKKKNLSNHGEGSHPGRGDIITKGADDDVVLDLDE